MSGLCGWINLFSGQSENASVIREMAKSLNRFDRSENRVLRHADYALAVAACDPGRRLVRDHGGAVIHGEVRFVEPGLARDACQQGLARTLMEGFRDRGPRILDAMTGPFAIAVVLEKEKRALLAVDRVGICPLYYCLVDGGLIFASTSDSINLHPRAPVVLDPQALFHYLYFHMVPSPFSIYKNRRRLEPAGYVYLADGRIECGTYWKIRYSRETEKLSVAELKQEFRELLRASVRRTLDERRFGAFLSGGTDSSTVTGVLGEISREPVSTYSIGFDVEGYDEMEYARIAARRFKTRHHEYYVTPADVVAAIPKIAQVYAEPFGNASALAAYYCAANAKEDGVDKLLAGDGGDELFGGNARYAKQRLFSLYSDLPRAVRRGMIEPLVFSFPGGAKIGPIRKLRSYIEQARAPMPARLETYNLLERLGAANVLEAAFLASVDTAAPLHLLSQTYWNSNATTMLNRMLALDLKFTLADNDLPKVSKTCELAGIDVSYPLLDEELVAFAARLPVRLKLKGTRLRYFFKEALRDFLPPEIIAKKKHGFGMPFGHWVQTHEPLRELVGDTLNDLKRRAIVRPEFIDALLHTYLPAHPGYYGATVWLLIMLEQWHQAHLVR